MPDNPHKHVLFVTWHLPMDEEPGAMRPWMEAKLLRDAGNDVTVLTSAVHYMTGQFVGPGRGWCREEVRDGIRILRLWNITDYRRSFLLRVLNNAIFGVLAVLAGVLRVRRPIHYLFTASDPFIITPFVIVLTYLIKARVVVDERDLYPDNAIEMGILREGFVTRMIAYFQSWLRKRAAFCLAATPGIRQRLAEKGVPGNQTALLYNGDVYGNGEVSDAAVETSALPPSVQEFRAKHTCLIGYMGTLGQAFDASTILHAAAALKARPEIGLIILGSGERLQESKLLVQQLELENVLFAGYLPRQIARSILSQCQIALLAFYKASATSLPSKVMDYLRMGLPTIFAGEAHCDTAQLLREIHAGLAIPEQNAGALAQAITQLADNKEQRRAMGNAAQHWFQAHVNHQASLAVIVQALGDPQTA